MRRPDDFTQSHPAIFIAVRRPQCFDVFAYAKACKHAALYVRVSTSVVLLLWYCGSIEFGQVRLQQFKRWLVHIHHVPAFVVAKLQIVA